ncbi:MAG: primosomal protein N' [Planctomycetota bacterium]
MADLFQTEPLIQAGRASYANIAIERGIDLSPTGLTYRVPDKLAGLSIGERVIVPLGRKKAQGYVIQIPADAPELEPSKIKPVFDRAPGAVALPDDLVELARWIANYYVCPLGMVFGAMLPAAVTRGTGTRQQQLVRLVQPATDAIKLTKFQARVVDAARQQRGWVLLRKLADLAEVKTTGPIKTLIRKGLLETQTRVAVHSDLDLRAQAELKDAKPDRLSPGQQAALDALRRSTQSFGVHVLHGVTGSGKTEVYLQLIEQVLDNPADGQTPSTIVLVPEIALTPQTVGRFLARFGPDSVAVLHSGLTAAQRHAQWRRIERDETPIIVGARSAVFAPVKRLGLIIVDEEHDSSYKQDQLPRYHGRDVAIKRAQMAGVPVVLGSATPSLESYHNAVGEPRPGYHYHSLPDRVPGMKLPQVEIVDLTEERKSRRGVHLLSRRLEQRVHQAIDNKGQAMLLLNRRGYANYIACPDHRCGWMMTCNHCDATMVYHKDKNLPLGGVVRCHHCLAEQALPAICPECSKKITTFGLGTQRVEEELAVKFDGLRIARMDSDTMRRAEDYRRVLEQFRAGTIDVLLGTQMIAKGLDFPGVRLVGVISADTALNLPDFRAAERTFQLISQVAGRSGRSEQIGRVVLQTFSPESPSVALAAKHDYAAFARMELQTRIEMGLPPIGRMVRVVLRGVDHVKALSRATELAHNLEHARATLKLDVHLRGPFPCAIARVADHHRFEVQLLAKSAAPLQCLMTELRNHGKLISDQHTAVDVDPVSLL